MIVCTGGHSIIQGDPLTLAAELTIALLDFRRTANENHAGIGDVLMESIMKSVNNPEVIAGFNREHAAKAEKEAEK